MKKKQRVLIGISSGIAAYKVLELIPLLQKNGLDVSVMMTVNATKMVAPQQFESLIGRPVFVDLYPNNFDYHEVLKTRRVEHIELADSVDLVVLAPATANLIGKLAHGIADDVVTTTMMAITSPVMICPSMNVHMWNHPAVRQNLQLLKQYGYRIMEPGEGPLACGYDGKGRLPDVSMIAAEIIALLKRSKALFGKRIVVTAGGTQEKIDEVRYLTNRSSGKMGVAIADACAEFGADVTLLRSASSVLPRYRMNERLFESSDDLQQLLKQEVKTADVLFHVAAVSDFTVKNVDTGKVTSKQSHTIDLIPQSKILDQIKVWNPKLTLIAFKAEYGLSESELIRKAKLRLTESQADVIVANDISKHDRGFGVDTNEVIVVKKDGTTQKIPLDMKAIIARKIIEAVIM